jgi:hypothetical protein
MSSLTDKCVILSVRPSAEAEFNVILSGMNVIPSVVEGSVILPVRPPAEAE